MNSTQASEVFDWLLFHCHADLALQLYVYGSFLSTPEEAADVDVLVIYPEGRAFTAVSDRRVLESKFKDRFGVPLHAIYLSIREISEEADFIQRLLSASQRLR